MIDHVDLERVIKARPETVFSFFTDADRWLSWQGITAEIDPRPGGVFRMNVRGDGWASGRFLTVDPYRTIEFTWGRESRHRRDSVALEAQRTPAADPALTPRGLASLPGPTGHPSGRRKPRTGCEQGAGIRSHVEVRSARGRVGVVRTVQTEEDTWAPTTRLRTGPRT
jgi:uncharacterized protein YndB with AHSA1/START domain